MKNKKILEELGIFTLEYINEEFNKLKDEFIEMAPLKSNFDIEKFTVKREGNFIAHNFHFLMRQYSLTLGEVRRMLIEKEEYERLIDELEKAWKNGEKTRLIYTREGKIQKYTDLYLKQLLNQLDLLEINITNKTMSIINFEACRKKLIDLNGGRITNEQYQAEEPEYWKWFLQKKALNQIKQAKLGIREGTWDNIGLLEEPALINKNYQVKMLDDNGLINLIEAKNDIKARQILDYKYDETKKVLENKKDD